MSTIDLRSDGHLDHALIAFAARDHRAAAVQFRCARRLHGKHRQVLAKRRAEISEANAAEMRALRGTLEA